MRSKITFRSSILALVCCTSFVAPALADGARIVHVQAGELTDALETLATQTGVDVIYPAAQLRGVKTQGVSGTLETLEAFRRLIEGTSLVLTEEGSSILVSLPKTGDVRAEGVGIRLAQTAGVSAATSPAGEETSAEAPGIEERGIPEILVKGNRASNVDIVRTIDDPQPYYIFSGETIAQSGAVNVEEFLKRRLTMNTQAGVESQNVNANGTLSTINLRGLGADQTLILVNGRRTSGPTIVGGQFQFDLNSIPTAAIERIEVLPSSASAIYGGNAIGGVVNVILERSFTGGSFGMTYDSPLDHSAPMRRVQAGYGWALEGGKTNVMVHASWADASPLRQKDRPELLQRGVDTILRNNPSLLYGPGSPFSVGSTTNIASSDGSDLVLKDGTPLDSGLTYVPVGTSSSTPASTLSTGLLANAGRQNTDLPDTNTFRVGNTYIGPPDAEDKFFMISLRRQMSEKLEMFAEYFDSNTDSATPHFGVGHGYTVPVDSPYNPFQQQVSISMPIESNRLRYTTTETQRAVAGLVYDLPGEWRVAGDYTWSHSDYSRLERVVNSSTLNPLIANGSLNPFVDILADPLGVLPAAEGWNTGPSTLQDVGLRFSGPLFRLPAGRVYQTVGLGFRKEALDSGASFASIVPGDPASSQVRAYLPQSQEIYSLYSETRVPLLSAESAVRGVDSLELQLAGRLEKYDVGTNTAFQFTDEFNEPFNEPVVRSSKSYTKANPTVALSYRPVKSLMLRASYSRAFLPPAYSDLLPGVQQPNTTTVTDPSRGNTSYQAYLIRGGNPSLEPLESENYDLGIVYEPSFVPGLRLGVEWYEFNRTNLAFEPEVNYILTNEDRFADRITREAPAPGDPYGVGLLSEVDLSLLSANEAATRGWDFSVGYRYPTESHGTFSIDAQATRIRSFTQAFGPDVPAEEIVGQPNMGGPLRSKGNATVGWEQNGWTLNWTMVHFGSYSLFGTSDANIAAQGDIEVPSQTYHNALIGYRFAPDEERSGTGNRFGGLLSDLSVTAGIKNVFNKVPPLDVSATSLLSYYSQFGDSRLRTYWVSLDKRF